MREGQKFGLFLISLVALPFFAIGLLGLHAINKDLTSYQLTARQTSINQLATADAVINLNLKTITASIHKESADLLNRGLWGVRCIFQMNCQPYEEKRIDLLLSFDENGDRVYPPIESASQLYIESSRLKVIASSVASAKEKLEKLPPSEQAAGTWSGYQIQTGHHLLNCWRHDEKTLCAAINREWLIKHISETLAGIASDGPNQPIHLVGPNNQILWHSLTPPESSPDAPQASIPDTVANTDKNSGITTTKNTKTLATTAKDDTLILRRQLSSPLYFWHLAIMEPAPSNYKYPLTLIALILPLFAIFLYIARALFHSQRAALQDAEKRARFAASISHELRTPLTNLQLYADLILAKAAALKNPEGEAVLNYTKVISAESTRLSELVNNALTIAKTNEDTGERAHILAIPDHIITETTNRLAPLLDGVTGKISYRLNATIEVSIDRAALEQILVNLLDNARKYAKGYPIRISSRQEKNRLTITVRDWGQTFKKSDLNGLFTRYKSGYKTPTKSQQAANTTRTEEGFGLGLAVCQELAEANNGSITAEFADPGVRFIVTLETKMPVSENSQLENEGL